METDQEKAEILKKKIINQFNQNLLTVLSVMVNQPLVKLEPVFGKATSDAANELLLSSSLIYAMVDHGAPVELVFISEHGEKIDLVKAKTLNQDDLINIFLDNLKSNNPHENK